MKSEWKRMALAAVLILMASWTTAYGADAFRTYGADCGDKKLNCWYEIESQDKREVRLIPQTEQINTFGTSDITGELVIRDEVTFAGQTYTVVRIGSYAFRDLDKITSVVFGEKIQWIGDWVFWGSKELVSITFPHDLKTLGWGAFCECTSLQEVHIPSSTLISSSPFPNCTGLKKIVVDDVGYNPSNLRIINNALYRTYDYNGVDYNMLLDYPCGLTGSYVIDDCTERIANHVFQGSLLEEITVPATVQAIGVHFCFRMPGLKRMNVEWTDELPSIGANSFYRLGETTARALYVPDKGMKSEDDIIKLYEYSDWMYWFDDFKLYTPGNVEGLRVGNKWICRTQAAKFYSGLAAGEASYDLVTKTLTLNSAAIETNQNEEYGIENYGIDGLTIRLDGDNSIDANAAGVVLLRNTTIDGDGKLTIRSKYEEGIFIDNAKLNVEDAELDIASCDGDFYGKNEAAVELVDASLRLRPVSANGYYTVMNISDLTLDGCYLAAPTLGEYAPLFETVVDATGQPVSGTVLVTPGEAYDLCLGVRVTDDNYYDISYMGVTRGWAGYDPDTKTLYLEDFRVADNEGILYNKVDGLTVVLEGENEFSCHETGLWLFRDTKITGSGSLRVNSDYGQAVLIQNDNVELTIDNTTVNLYGADGGIYGVDGVVDQYVRVNHASVDIEATKYTPFTHYLDGFTLTNCAFQDSRHYYEPDSEGIGNTEDFGELERYFIIQIRPTAYTTDIDEAIADTPAAADQPLYDLQGRRLSGHPQRGIFIQGGKKAVF